MLKMLAGTAPDWAADTTVAYVNHKCVPNDSGLATHAKARAQFLDAWAGVQVVTVRGTAETSAEAASYEAALRSLGPERLPVRDDGLPVFDMCIIGVGDDGHIGSLYPARDEAERTDKWILPVDMKDPGSITFSLPVMAAAKSVLIAACGVSDKYPKGKADAMFTAMEGPVARVRDFPAAGLRPVADWIIDEAAAAQLTLV